MRISKYLKEEFCVMDLKAEDKNSAIAEIAGVLKKSKELTDAQAFLDDVFKREELSSTGIGDGVAIPHGRTDAVREFIIGFGRSKDGLDFNSLDGKKVHLVFLMGASNKDLNLYLRLLAELSRLIINGKFRQDLMNAQSPKEVCDLVLQYEGMRNTR